MKEDGQDARAFAFDYFAVDPMHFGSGYAKEWLLRKVKRCEFTEAEANILRQLIVNRVRNGAMRDFKKICGLIPPEACSLDASKRFALVIAPFGMGAALKLVID